MSLELERRRLKITEAILADPAAKTAVIAERTGCTPAQVNQVRSDLAYQIKCQSEELIEEYQRGLLEKIPLDKRVDVLKAIVNQHKRRPAQALAALQAVDKLCGLTPPERIEHTGADGGEIISKVEITYAGPKQ